MTTYKIKTTEIDYSVEEEDLYCEFAERHQELEEDSDEFYDALNAEIEKVKESLPQELELEITCDSEDLDDCICDAVSNETNWLVNYVNYEIIL